MAVSAAMEPITCEITREEVSMVGGGADVVSTAGVAELEVGVIDGISVAVETAGMETSVAGSGAVSVVEEAGVSEAVAVSFLASMSA